MPPSLDGQDAIVPSAAASPPCEISPPPVAESAMPAAECVSAPPHEPVGVAPEGAPAPEPVFHPAAVPDPRDEACRILLRLESPEARARELVDETLNTLAFKPEDGALLSELVFGTLRKRALLDYRLSAVSHRPLEVLSPWVRNLLRLSLYQLLCLDRVPAAAAVDAAAEISKRHGHDGVAKFVNGCLGGICR